MKRVGYLFESVVAFDNLLLAHKRARRGKRGRPALERFSRRLEPELFRLQDELVSGRYRPGGYLKFEVWDPKQRTISVAPFRDRVVHHALIAVVQEHMERGMDPDSYGCRVGKGTDGALARAVQLTRRQSWCLKTDVSSFFASVDHDVLLAQLDRLFKDRQLMALMELIVDTGGCDGRGLPIGNLTSQWFANLYLTPLDRFVRRQEPSNGYIRYMDDALVFGCTSAGLRGLARTLEAYLRDGLHLEINHKLTHVYPTREGVPFLGFRVCPGGLKLRRATWRRFVQRKRRREWEYRQGRVTLETLSQSVASMLAHLDRASTRSLRRQQLAKEAAVEW